MDRDPGDFEHTKPTRRVSAPPATDFDDQLRQLKPVPGLPQTSDETAAADAAAVADIGAGRVHSHAIVAEWLATWGQPGRLAFKDWFAQRDG